MARRVAVTGANSAVGQAIVRAIATDPSIAGPEVELVACVRSERAEAQLPPLPDGSRAARVAYDAPDTLRAALAGADAAIHLPGVLFERPGSSYESANVATTRTLVEAARDCGVAKLVLVSAVGADHRSENRYYRTKGEAEQLLHVAGIAYSVLRAPLVLGRGTEGSRGLLRLARAKRAFMIAGGKELEQPILVDDLARAALVATRPDVAKNAVLDLVGPESLPDHELVTRIAKELETSPRIVPIPAGPVRALLALRTRLLGPGFSPDTLDVLIEDTKLDPAPAAQALGIELAPVSKMVAELIADDA